MQNNFHFKLLTKSPPNKTKALSHSTAEDPGMGEVGSDHSIFSANPQGLKTLPSITEANKTTHMEQYQQHTGTGQFNLRFQGQRTESSS